MLADAGPKRRPVRRGRWRDGLAASPATTSYLYDAFGNLLLQSDPGATTLYLADEQIVLNTAANTVSGTRYYQIGGVTVAARTSAGQVEYLIGDRLGTSQLSIDSQTLAVSRRYYDPYGQPIGTPPAAWPGTRGYVGGTADTATGLTSLGAREYNPATTQFLSPDPLLSPYNPKDLDPYAYAQDSPSTSADPSGLALPGGGGQCPPGFTCHPGTGGGGASGPGGNDGGDGGGGGGGGGSSRGSSTPPVTQISPHVYASGPGVQKLQTAWQWVVHTYGAPHNAEQEFADWWHICGISPDSSVCQGQFGLDFNITSTDRMIRTTEAFRSGGKLVVASIAAGGSFFVPEGMSSGALRALVRAYRIYSSPQFDAIRAAQSAGETVETRIADTTVIYEPDLPSSGFSLQPDGFAIGPDAFASQAELVKTILHESYRLENSASSGGVNADLASKEAMESQSSAEDTYRVLLGRASAGGSGSDGGGGDAGAGGAGGE